MGSAILELQRDIAGRTQGATHLLRRMKLIASKLNLVDLEKWVDHEVRGYQSNDRIPDYRHVLTTHIEIHNPVRGWVFLGHLDQKVPIYDQISQIEAFSNSDGWLMAPLHEPLPVKSSMGMARQWPQRAICVKSEFNKIVEAVLDELLAWSIRLEKAGVLGEGMEFNIQEKQIAQGVIMHVHGNTGIVAGGNVSDSSVTLYNYGAIHQQLRDAGVPQNVRNEIENLMDELKKATPSEKQGVLARVKKWVVENKTFLGAAGEIVVRAFGFPSITALLSEQNSTTSEPTSTS